MTTFIKVEPDAEIQILARSGGCTKICRNQTPATPGTLASQVFGCGQGRREPLGEIVLNFLF